MDARRLQLKIQIDTVKSITVRLCHHIFNQFFAHRRPERSTCLHVLGVFAAEIVEYRPDLQTFFMRPIHIGLICQRFIRAAVAAKRKPRRAMMTPFTLQSENPSPGLPPRSLPDARPSQSSDPVKYSADRSSKITSLMSLVQIFIFHLCIYPT